ncbi:mitochondrial protein Pet127, partial [Rozella allomycis CSF55]
NILTDMGHVFEKLVVTTEEEFSKILNFKEEPKSNHNYVYNQVGLRFINCQAGSFLIRSQIDCQHEKLQYHRFDIKSRATFPIRFDKENYSKYFGYELRKDKGLYNSFEKEYYDMHRSAMLKYYFQVRLGHMDGIFVIYHSVRNIFGF